MAEINWYFPGSMVSSNLCQEYLNMATFRILVLLLIKRSTFWYIDRLPTSSYAGVIHFKNGPVFLAHPVYYIYYKHRTAPAADLGMFSMFGWTVAPTKGAANCCMPEQWAIPEWRESDEQFLRRTDSWHTTHGRWWLKRSPVYFSGKIGSAAPVEGSPHFFWTGPCWE